LSPEAGIRVAGQIRGRFVAEKHGFALCRTRMRSGLLGREELQNGFSARKGQPVAARTAGEGLAKSGGSGEVRPDGRYHVVVMLCGATLPLGGSLRRGRRTGLYSEAPVAGGRTGAGIRGAQHSLGGRWWDGACRRPRSRQSARRQALIAEGGWASIKHG
jgi:hypothetical protein